MRNLFQKSREYLDGRHLVAPLDMSQSSLEAWFQTKYGQYLLQREQEALRHVMPELTAHRMMCLGITSKRLLNCEFNHLHHFSIGASADSPGDNQAIADFDALPLPSESVDTVLLHHALEFSQYPHDVLREMTRVLTPCGHMVLVVMNPMSLMGIAKWPARLMSSQAVWRHHSLRHRQLLDWLRLLNCHPINAVSGGYPWPLKLPRGEGETGFIEKLGQRYQLPWGAFYIVVARKYVARPTPLGPRIWKSIRIPMVSGVKKNSVINKSIPGEK